MLALFGTLRNLMPALVGAVLAIAVTVIFYEGLPIGPIRYIPVVGPALEFVTGGRVDRERDAARKDLVQVAELNAALAEANELRRQVAAGQKTALEFQAKLDEVRRTEAAEDVQQEREIASYEMQLAAAGRRCDLNADDQRWLQQP